MEPNQLALLQKAPKIALTVVIVCIVWLIAAWLLPISGLWVTLSMWLAAIVLFAVVLLAGIVYWKIRSMQKQMEAMLGSGDLADLLNSPMGQQMMQMAQQMQTDMPQTSDAQMEQMQQMMQAFGGMPGQDAEVIDVDGEEIVEVKELEAEVEVETNEQSIERDNPADETT